MRRLLIVLGCALVCLVVPRLAGPHDGFTFKAAFQAVATISLLATAAGAWRHRRALGSVGVLVVGGSLAVNLADAVLALRVLRDVPSPFPDWTDGLYLTNYVAFTAAALILTRRRSPGRDTGALLDAATLMVGAGVVAYSFSIAQIADDSTASTAAKVVGSLYPLGDVLVVGVVARLLFTGHGHRTPVLFLAGGMICQLAGDIGFTLAVYTGREHGTWVDSLYLLQSALTACAFWLPDTARLGDRTRARGERLGPVRQLTLAAGALLAPVTLLVQNVTGAQQHVRMIAVAAMALFGLTVLRMRLLIRAVERQSDQLARLARTDSLTGLANRRTFEFELGRAMNEVREAAAEGRRRPLSVGLMDLDRFKQFNDSHGHGRGDELLKEAAAHWTDALSRLAPSAVMARWGGEEFVVLFRDLGPAAAATVLRRLIPITPMEQTFSAGVAAWDGAEPALDLLNRADARLYEAKAGGRRAVKDGDAELPLAEHLRR